MPPRSAGQAGRTLRQPAPGDFGRRPGNSPGLLCKRHVRSTATTRSFTGVLALLLLPEFWVGLFTLQSVLSGCEAVRFGAARNSRRLSRGAGTAGCRRAPRIPAGQRRRARIPGHRTHRPSQAVGPAPELPAGRVAAVPPFTLGAIT